MNNLTLDYRDWFERKLDPTDALTEATKILWEFGLEGDVTIEVSKRVYDIITSTDYMPLKTAPKRKIG